MFKLPIAAAIGLTAAISTASADQILLPAPLHVPAISAHGPAIGGFGTSTYDSPSFGRLVEMCARMGFDCAAPAEDRPSALFDLHGLSEAARADAEKRMALYAEQWAELAEDSIAPAHSLHTPAWQNPHGISGYSAPRVTPYAHGGIFGFGHRAPVVPGIRVLPGHRFPYAPLAHGTIRNNPVFPWPSL